MKNQHFSTEAIGKTLSRNDTGESGGHQAGILVPKQEKILSYFPILTNSEKNPRVNLSFLDHNDDEWFFTFIYYNNKYFGGTRNEFRLTGMTKYFRLYDLVAGDELYLSKDESGQRYCSFDKTDDRPYLENGVLKLSSTWKTVSINPRR